jgi:catechol 2,3-dioxygenase-like lactoylglutathione lyase family enzyme
MASAPGTGNHVGMRLHHVQVGVPRGGEDAARRFYGDALGLAEVDKPPLLAVRGGCWFRAFDGDVVTAEVHVSVEDEASPSRNAHPAFVVGSAHELERLGARVAELGFEVSWADRDTFPGYVRFHCRDAAGNRVEVMTPTP